MSDDSPTLEVGFAIDFNNSFGDLKTLDDLIGTTQANAVREFQKIEQASRGAVNLSGATAQFTTFGGAATRELASVARETSRAEKAAEGMVRQLDRQAQTFGKNATEIRQMRAELRAVAAEDRGLTELATRLRAASAEMDRLEASSGGVETVTRRNGFAMKQFALQMPDVVQGLLTGQKPMQVLIQQGGQLVQVAQMAEGGVRGFASELVALALPFAPLIALAAAATAGFALFARWVNEGVTNNQLTKDLGDITGGAGASKEELYKLRDATVSWGSVTQALFSEVGKDISKTFVGDMQAMSAGVKAVLNDLTSYGKAALAGLYAGLQGTQNYLAELQKAGFAGLGKALADPDLLKKTYGVAYDQADKYLTDLGARVRKTAVQIEREKLAEKIGYNAIPKPKTNGHAEQLEREAKAIEAQIRNLYALADAYRVSGAEALIAEARVKAESAAIKGRADIEAAVERQIRLSIAQRVSDAAKATAGIRDQIAAQQSVNAMVEAGIVPSERAANLVRDQIADLPLLAAIQVAQQRGYTKEIEAATRALEDQRASRAALTAAEATAKFNTAMFAGDDRLAVLKEELRLVGETDAARTRALATLRATQEAAKNPTWSADQVAAYVAMQVKIADLEAQRQLRADAFNESLAYQADLLDAVANNISNAAQGMADAFGNAGQALGSLASQFADFIVDQKRLTDARDAELRIAAQITNAEIRTRRERQIGSLFAVRSATAQVGLFGDMTSAAKGFFKEGSNGYKALETAEKAFRAVEFALSVRAMAQDAIETGSKIASSVARTAVAATEAVVNAIKSLPFPLNLAAGAATIAALASIGVGIAGSFGGGGNKPAPSNTGTGTVFGDSSAKSESIKRSIDALKDVDTLTNTYAREMMGSLRSIDASIGGLSALLVRAGNIDASANVQTGFKPNAIGSILGSVPLVGGILKGLFGTKTSVIGSGLFGGAQSVGSILNGGFDASYYSDVKKTKKFFGISTGSKYSTQFGAADPNLENQFTLILRQFNTAIAAAAGPLGVATDEVQNRLNGFIVDIGKIDLQGLTGEEIQEKLNAVFGAAADNMANAAFPGMEKFQKVGEGAFETLVRVASTVEQVTTSLDLLGAATRSLGIDAKLGLADQFESVSDMTSAVESYFEAFYSREEQAAAKTAQLGKVFDSLGLTMPTTLQNFRALVEAQNLTTAAGQATYATLLQLAPAFADLKTAMDGAKSAADIMTERQDLQRQLLELMGNTAAIRALDLAKLDPSNRALQQQIYAIQDAQEAAKAAEQLREAWTSVGDSIMDEVRRIRGLTGTGQDGSFASLMGQFNAANSAARGGDQDAAKSLPGLSQALLKAAAEAATSRQELERVQAQTAASLEATFAAIGGIANSGSTSAASTLAAAAMAAQASSAPTSANDDLLTEVQGLRAEVAGLRSENNAGHAATAGNTGAIKRTLDNVTASSGGDAVTVVSQVA